MGSGSLTLRRIAYLVLTLSTTVTVLGLLGLQPTYPPVSYAESGEKGLLINKDKNDNINVTVDPSMISRIQIDRQPDKMVIDMQDNGDDSKILIDSILKSGNVVDVKTNGNNKRITIKSTQVYMDIQDLSGKSFPGPAKPQPVSAIKPQAIPVKPQPAAVKPLVPVVSSAKAKTEAKPALVKPEKSVSVQSPPARVKDIPAVSAMAVETPEEPAVPTPAQDEGTLKSQSVSDVDMTDMTETADDNSIPLSALQQQQENNQALSQGVLGRMVISLLAVLLLVFGFTKVLLPKLQQRYPEFFERLRERHEQNQQHQAHVKKARHHDRAHASSSPQKAYLETLSKKTGLQTNEFNVITSSKISKDKELHLVEIRGHHLVIATTQHTVSLIKELDEPVPQADFTDLQQPPPNIYGYLPELQEEDDLAHLYKKYLTGSVSDVSEQSPSVSEPTHRQRSEERQSREQQQKQVAEAVKTSTALRTKPLRDEPPYIDAEEVIVLKDYDDIF